MRGEQTTEDTRRRYYFTGYDYLNKYNSEIIEPQMKIKEYLTEQRPEYFNGAFITITITRNISSRILINNLGKLIRYTNELLFSSSIRKTGKGMNGIGSVEKQVNGNMHFHLLLERREEYGDGLNRLIEKLKLKSKKFDGLFNFDKGFDVQLILEPERAEEYIIKKTELRTLHNLFFVYPEGVIGLNDDGCYRLSN